MYKSILFYLLFASGMAFIFWMAGNFTSEDIIALSMIGLIGVGFSAGFVELVRYRKASSLLASNLVSLKTEKDIDLETWLSKLPTSLVFPIKQRIETGSGPLPAPVFVPYLLGLLVMLGLLGTFAGMVETLKGAMFALEGTSELEAIRAGLAAPIGGLSLAFGTSVAGVGASALLGLMNTLSQRERKNLSVEIDHAISTTLAPFSHSHQRQQALISAQSQAQFFNEFAPKLDRLIGSIDAMGQSVASNLQAGQSQYLESMSSSLNAFTQELGEKLNDNITSGLSESAANVHSALADSSSSLIESMESRSQKLFESLAQEYKTQLQETSKVFSENIASMSSALDGNVKSVESAILSHEKNYKESSKELIDGIAEAAHSNLTKMSQQQLDWSEKIAEMESQRLEKVQTELESLSKLFAETTEAMHAEGRDKWEALILQSEELVRARVSSEEDWAERFESNMKSLNAETHKQIEGLLQVEQERVQKISEEHENIKATLVTHLTALGEGLEAPLSSLLETVSETPKAATKVISQLQEEMLKNSQRDNELTEEKAQLVADLQRLFSEMEANTESQSEAVEKMVEHSASTLESIESSFSSALSDSLQQLNKVGEELALSTQDMSSLGGAFAHAVEHYGETNSRLMDSLNEISLALGSTAERSDEQLAYYVAQARELIDHSLVSQQALIEKIESASKRQAELA